MLDLRRRRSRSAVHDVAGEPDNSRSGLTGSWSGSAATRPVSATMREQAGSSRPSSRSDSQPHSERTSPEVDWTIQGAHPLAGRYRSKDAL